MGVGKIEPVGGFYVARQEDAHSWVEAYVRPYGWRTFDPSIARAAATPRPVFVRRWYRHVYDAVDRLWVRNVITYDAQTQRGLITGALLRVDDLARKLSPTWYERLDRRLRSVRDRLIALGWFGTLVRVVGAGAGLALRWVAWLLLRGIVVRSGRRVRPALKIYERMERLLRRCGFERGLSQTPWEFHAAVAAAKWPAAEAVALITRVFCDVRYGERPLGEEDATAAETALRKIRQARKQRRGRRG